MIKCFFLISFLFASLNYSQNLDSLYNSLLVMSDHQSVKGLKDVIESTQPGEKCGFGIAAQIRLRYDEFSIEQQNVISEILSRPERQTSIVSPSGIFRVHFDTTGINKPDYFPGNPNSLQLSLDSLVIAFDSAYNYEINILNYIPPPDDEGDGGDDRYDIYISRLGGGYYGWTDFEARSDGKWKSYITIDNLMDVPTPGINGVRVTAAHEYHHAIQGGSYRLGPSKDLYYFEVTSTSMEEFVYDDINDYYNYLSTYFRHPDRRFTVTQPAGYERVIWNVYLQERFLQDEGDYFKGLDIIKRSWELMRDDYNRSAIEAIGLALAEVGITFKNEFNNFGIWCYFTDYRAKEDKYFEEAENYPLIKPFMTYKFTPPQKDYFFQVEPTANNFTVFELDSSIVHDTIVVRDTLVSIITNGDIVSAATDPYPSIDYGYSLMTEPVEGANKIISIEKDGEIISYYSKITSEQKGYLSESNIFFEAEKDTLIPEIPIKGVIPYPYPQPFNYSKHDAIYIPVKNGNNEYATLNIYSISMKLVLSKKTRLFNYEKIFVIWDGLDNNGDKLPTGVYIYATESDEQIITGKIVIYNE